MSSVTDSFVDALQTESNSLQTTMNESQHFMTAIAGNTKTESTDSVKTTQLAQWVYIQAPPKITISTQAVNKTSPTNILVNSMAPLQISSISNKPSMALPNQSVILAHPVNSNTVKPQLVLQKPNIAPKNGLTYVTMFKPATNLAPNIPGNQKFVIAPMPKMTNRLPTTMTTNCVQSKIALMPVTLQNTINTPSSQQKKYNIRISEGKIQTLCNNEMEDTKLICNEALEAESIEDKSYELSIVEDSTSKNDVSFTITIPDDLDKTHSYRDSHKFSKHGVSILKRNNVTLDKPEKTSNLIITPISNSITTISDSNTKEVKITSPNFDTPLITEHKKSERRRKSTFSYRKDYDDVIVTANNNYFEFSTPNRDSNMTAIEPIVEIEVIKEKPDINMNEKFDAKKILNWEDGIGSLPGSEIKFQINEFGFLEYMKKDELENKLAKPKQTKKEDFQEEMRCVECGCYGMPSEFITPKYCSYDCQDSAAKTAKLRETKLKRKTKAWLKKNYCDDREEVFSEEEQIISNENSQDKFNYPWTCTKKGFSWAKYLEHIKAKAVPVKFFKDPFPYNRNGFRPGMKLEGVDPQHPKYFCVLSVAEVIGYRVRLHFDGFSENYDFWLNADSMDIFPAGWCEKYGHALHPPPGYTHKDFNWTTYLKQTKSTVAPKHLFANRAGSAICPNGFRIGMKLEAVDRKNTSLICVSTVADMMDNRILVHFDSWDDIYDYWADPMSPYIHPVGWCDQNGHSLTPPNDYPHPELFTWEKYLKETKTVAAPVRAFKQRPVYGFKRGMRLECVDKRVPQLIRAATVDDVKEHQIRISFDGWPDRYSYWVDNDSSNIHPVGWCQKTGHPIEPPLTPDDVYDFLECPTVGCRGQGHVKGPQFSLHSTTKDCPYADENMYKDRVIPDRLLSPDRELEAVVPISREPPKEKIKAKVGRPPKMPRIDPPIKIEYNDEILEEDPKPLKHKTPPRSSKSSDTCSEKDIKKEILPLTNGYTSVFAEQIWEKHSYYLNDYVKPHIDPRRWNVEDVVKYLSTLPFCKSVGNLFREQRIDGEALLMLCQQDLVDILNIKLGPAIKLYSIIVMLRRRVL